jgi:uncharacterized protein YigA (DUF484 family)
VGDDTEFLTAERVAEYLIEHPNFLFENPEVLEQLHLSDAPPGTISLAQRQLENARDKSTQLHEQLHALIDNARQNNELQTRVHQLCLKLMDVHPVDALFPLLVSELKQEFNADEVSLRLFHSELSVSPLPETSENIAQLHSDDEVLKPFDGMLAKLTPICGRLSAQQKQVLFGDHANKVKSVACLPLGHNPCAGVLAIASYDENRFHADMATDYLAFLGEVIMRILRPFAT